MKTLELTPAELEMIKINREKAELAAKEAAAKKQVQLEKDIAGRKELMQKTMKMDADQVKATQDFCNSLGAGYKLEIATREEKVIVTGDYTNPEDPASDGYRREIVWQDAFNRQSAKIVYKGYSIRVEEQIVYSSKWASRGTSNGFKMYVSGPGLNWKDESRAYTRITTVKAKIKDAIDSIKAEEDYKNKQKGALQLTVDKFQSEYPDAEVSTDKGYERGYGRSYADGITYDKVSIKFANGASIAYRVYADGSLSRVSFNLPASKDEATFRNNLSQMKF